MEYTDYWVARGSSAAVRDKLSGKISRALIVDGDSEFVPFAAADEKLEEKLVSLWPWLLKVFDAEGSAWGFELWLDGSMVGSGTYGENAEWGIDGSDNGFEGDVEAVAQALGTTSAKLKRYLNAESVYEFCNHVGFTHQYMLYPHEEEMPAGVHLMSDQ